MTDLRTPIALTLQAAGMADVSSLRSFLTSNPSQPLVATGSGGAETAADYAALLYGARGGVATAMSPYTMNSLSEEALKTSKVLLVSAGGHNNDIAFAARRALDVNRKTPQASHCTAGNATRSTSSSAGRAVLTRSSLTSPIGTDSCPWAPLSHISPC